MTVHKYTVALEKSEVQKLTDIIHKGMQKARVITRARVLLMANENGEGKTDKIIAAALGVTKTTPQDIRRRYAHGGLKRALFDAPRPGKERIVTGSDEAHIVSIACTDPPDGHDRWTLNLLTETVPKTVGKTLGRSTIYRVLLRNDLKPWREKNMVHQGKG